MEENEGSMRKAAHLMVSSLAGSLALVTCREPLRSSLATQLRHLLANTMEASQLDQTVNVRLLLSSCLFRTGFAENGHWHMTLHSSGRCRI